MTDRPLKKEDIIGDALDVIAREDVASAARYFREPILAELAQEPRSWEYVKRAVLKVLLERFDEAFGAALQDEEN